MSEEAAALRIRARRLRGEFKRVKAPARFSIVDNPEDSLKFIAEIRSAAVKANLFLDLSRVEVLTADAVSVMLATIKAEGARYARYGGSFQGNQPRNAAARRILVESGFFKHVQVNGAAQFGNQGHICSRESHQVEPHQARQLIHHASGILLRDRKKCPAAYRTLIECMNNTRNHAAADAAARHETWWATVFADIGPSIARYTFVDTGVGIFESVKIRGFFKRMNAMFRDESHLLRGILNGSIGSRTGLPFRGKGLPAIFELLQRGAIRRLVIVANNVFADVG